MKKTSIGKKRAAESASTKGMLLGYARVSTEEQSLDLQVSALEGAGCGKIFTEKKSGATVDRPALQELLSPLRASDTVVVWKLDRRGRGVKGLVDLVNDLEAKQVHFRSLTDSIDTSTPMGRFFFHIMSALAQMERELIVERTRAGLEAARRLGRVGGRKRRFSEKKAEAARKLLAAGTERSEVAQNLGVSIQTLYRWLPASERA